MQFVSTLSLLARRWWVVLVSAVVVVLLALGLQAIRPVVFVAETTATVTRVNRAQTEDFQYDNFYAAQATEIVVNSASRLFETGDFALAVSERAERGVSQEGALDFARSFQVKQMSPHLLRVRATDANEDIARANLEAAIEEVSARVKTMEVAEPVLEASSDAEKTASDQPAFRVVADEAFVYPRVYAPSLVVGAALVAGVLLGIAIVVLEAAIRSSRRAS